MEKACEHFLQISRASGGFIVNVDSGKHYVCTDAGEVGELVKRLMRPPEPHGEKQTSGKATP